MWTTLRHGENRDLACLIKMISTSIFPQTGTNLKHIQRFKFMLAGELREGCHLKSSEAAKVAISIVGLIYSM